MNNQEAINKLYNYRENIEDILVEIEALIQIHFPEEYSVAYQHWIPQIKTALRDNLKYLPRGQYSMDYTLEHLIDKIDVESIKGVNKYIP